jgi:glycine cleavage system H protein
MTGMVIQGFDMPDDLYYDENHYWIRVEGDLIVMGMDDFGQKLAEEIVYVQLPFVGKTLTAGKKFAQVESGKWVGKIYAPMNGKIAAVNENLEESPGLINEDCYARGWMFSIEPADMAELSNLIHGSDAVENWVLEDIEKYMKK